MPRCGRIGSRARVALCLATGLLVGLDARAQDVVTGGYGNERTNADLFETTLTSSNVRAGKFGRLFTLTVDGQIYAQPLYQRNLSIAGRGTHNVVFAATMHNSVYAFDSDLPGTPLWHVNLGPSVDTAAYGSDDGDYQDIQPENGILSTPVIDPATNTMYVVAATVRNGFFLYELHALDTSSGKEKPGSPGLISGQVSGIGDSSTFGAVSFVPAQHIQRPALLLSNGAVYVAFGSHGDAAPYHGWIMSYSAANVQQLLGIFNASPNGSGGAFWQSGRGLTADAQGNVFAVSSNGDTDDRSNFSDNVLRLDGASLTVRDWFAPADFPTLNDSDNDLGACGAVLIPGTDLLLAGGKEGVVYLLDKGSLGHTNATDGQILQSFQAGPFGIFNMAVWARPDGAILYAHPANSAVRSWQLSGGLFPSTPTAQSVNGFLLPFQGMTISANGYQSGTGVLWILTSAGYPLPSPGVLHAYDAETLDEVWSSTMDPLDAVGPYVKFVNPTVADGKVFVPALSNELVVYGLKTSVPAMPSLTAVVNAADYSGGAIAPGEIVALFGQNIGPADLVIGSFDGFGNLSRQLFGMQVTFNNVPAPLLYTSAGVAAAIVPYEVGSSESAVVQLSYNGLTAAPQTVPLAAAAPAIFTEDSTGRGQGAILNEDFSVNTAANPANQGAIVVVYATGGGVSAPAATTGAIPNEAAWLAAPVEVTVGGQQAEVLYAGNAGGEVAGTVQLNLRLPAGVTGQVPIVLTVGGKSSQGLATVSIR